MEPIIKENTLAGFNTKSISQFLSLASIAIILPFLIHLQIVTGPFVNAILIIALFLVGIRSALVLCLVPSLMALAGGLLPAVLAPAVPFIMISNVLFILIIEAVYERIQDSNKGYWWGIMIASAAKFLFLFISATFIVRILAKQELAVKVAQMMSWPQFATALAGGILAWVFLRWLKRL